MSLMGSLWDRLKRLLGLVKPEDLKVVSARYERLFIPEGYVYPGEEKFTLDDYKRAVDEDTTIPRALDTLIYSVLSIITEYSHPNQEIEDFVKENLQRMQGDIKQVMYHLLWDGMVYGFAVAEKVWKIRDGKVYLDEIVPIDPRNVTFYVKEGVRDLYIYKVRVATIGGSYREMDPSKVIIYRHLDKRSLYGKSRIERVMKYVEIKRLALKWWSKAVQKYGDPLVKVKWNGAIDFDDPRVRKKLDAMVELLRNLHHNPIIVEDQEYEIEIEKFPNLGADFRALIESCDEAIYNAILLPPLLAGGEGGGSYALGKKQFDLYMMAVNSIADEIVEVVIEQLIRDLIEYNFGPVGHWGRFGKKKLDIDRMDEMLKVYSKAYDIGILTKDDVNRLREVIGLPPIEGAGEEGSRFDFGDLEVLSKAVEKLEKAGVLDDELRQKINRKIRKLIESWDLD